MLFPLFSYHFSVANKNMLTFRKLEIPKYYHNIWRLGIELTSFNFHRKFSIIKDEHYRIEYINVKQIHHRADTE